MPAANEFPGKCIRCGERVEPLAGYVQIGTTPFTRSWGFHKPGSAVYVEHRACHDRFDGTNTHYVYFPAEENSK